MRQIGILKLSKNNYYFKKMKGNKKNGKSNNRTIKK